MISDEIEENVFAKFRKDAHNSFYQYGCFLCWA